MRLNQDQVEVVAFRVIHDLAKRGLISVTDFTDAEARMTAVITEELRVEDVLNDEVRDLMRVYEDQIRRADVEYHEMFKAIKARLAHERNIIL